MRQLQSLSQQPRVLVISNCTKRKSKVIPSDAIFGTLKSWKNREKVFNHYRHLEVEAQKLYLGSQHEKIRSIITKLQKYATVDHKILSAAHGLINADTLICPYDATFRGKSEQQLKIMKEDLKIQEAIKSIDQYDQIFLILSQNYLRVLKNEIHRIDSKCSELILFDFDEYDLPYKINEFRRFRKKNLLPLPVGRNYHARAFILLNYIDWIQERDKYTYFCYFWNDLVNENWGQ